MTPADANKIQISPWASRPAWWFGWRYLRARKRNQYVSFMSLSSSIGLALGVAVLITVLSIMNGFGEELRARILGTVPHILVYSKDPDALEALTAQLSAHPDVEAAAPYFETSAMLMRSGGMVGIGLLGIEPTHESAMSIVPQHMVSGSIDALRAGARGVVLGEPLALHLGVSLGDNVQMMVPSSDGRGGVRPLFVTLRLAGTFAVNAEVDYGLAFVHWRDVAALGLDGAGRYAVRLRTPEVLNAPQVAARIRASLPEDLSVSDWSARYGQLFQAVGMEKAMMGILLALVITIASFNVVSSMVMLVDDKQGDIAVLRTMGGSKRMISRVYLGHATVIGSIGLVTGILLGLFLSMHISEVVRVVELISGTRLLEGTYFDEIPSRVQQGDVFMVAALAVVITLTAAVFPARRAARLDPVAALHRD